MWAVPSVFGVGLVVALFVGGCDGSGEGSTTLPTTTTTTTTTTTVAPTTTLDPIAAEEAAVSEAAAQARYAATAALTAPDDPSAVAGLDDFYVPGSAARQTIDEALADFRRQGLRVRANPNIAESVTVEQVALSGEPPIEADLTVCVVDPSVVYEPDAGPDGSDVIVNDIIYSHRLIYRMQKVDGVWRLAGVDNVDRWEGVTRCPPAT
jgi:hypothetical protein